jgi:peroxiredoxin
MALLETPRIDKNFTAKDFNLLSIDGKHYSLADVKKENGLIIAFICNHCPYVKAIADKIAKEVKELQKINIGFIGINPNDINAYPEDSYENMKFFAAKHNWDFPYVVDSTQEVAKLYGAVCTPDFFGFDNKLKLQYRGRLDSAGKQDIPNATRELFIAMQAVVSFGAFDGKQYPSIGCSIKWCLD